MRLKIFLVPFLILAVMVLAIGYIQPEIMLLQAKKVEIEAKNAQIANADTIISNIDSLSRSLDSDMPSERFVNNYLPKDMDQERVIDALNYSALQTGVLVESMEVVQPAEPIVLTQIDASGQEVPIEVLNPDGTPLLPEITPKTFSTKVSVKGSYENIKNFFSRASHANRYYMLNGFSIGPSDRDVASETPDANALVGTFYANFDYLKMQKTNSAINSDVFKHSTIEFLPLKSTIEWVSNNIPLLEKPTTGKPNPFQ